MKIKIIEELVVGEINIIIFLIIFIIIFFNLINLIFNFNFLI
jgi:hypothetical protein